jgi:hypothetical protein
MEYLLLAIGLALALLLTNPSRLLRYLVSLNFSLSSAFLNSLLLERSKARSLCPCHEYKVEQDREE